MNLRDIKKDIEFFIEEFLDDCALFIGLNPEKNSDEINKIIDEAVDLYNELKDKINHPEGTKRSYYNGIRKELFDRLETLSEMLSETITRLTSEEK